MRWILWSALIVVGAILGGAAAADATQLFRGSRELRRQGKRPPRFPDLAAFPTIAVRVGRPRFRSRRSRVLRGIGWSFAVVVLLLGSATVYVLHELARIDRFNLALSKPVAGTAMNILLVGTDSRRGTDVAPGEEVTGQRADTILVLRVGGPDGAASLLSIPRDLWVQPPGHDRSMKINATYAESRQLLVDTIVRNLHVPIHHYLELDFAGFQRLVDEVSGINVNVAEPMKDDWTGLYLPTPGCHHLDGAAALALVRSRHPETYDGVEWQSVAGADRGRMDRQRWFLLNLANALRGLDVADPFRIRRLLNVAGDDVGLDTGLSFSAMRHLAGVLHGIDPTTVESNTVPAAGFTAPDGSDALRLIDADAAPVLRKFADEVAPTVVTTTVAAGPTSDAAAAAPQMTTTASVTEPVSTERPLVSACVN